MNDKFYIRKIIRSDGKSLAFDEEEIYLDSENTLLNRPDPETTSINYTAASGGEMLAQKNPAFSQEIKGIIVPKNTSYWQLVFRLTAFFKINYTYKIIYAQKSGTLFSVAKAWISAGLQVPPQPREDYAKWSVTFAIGDESWREYAEDAAGNEMYANKVELSVLSGANGGEDWDSIGGVWEMPSLDKKSASGVNITISDAVAGALQGVQLFGQTEQTTYSGKNLVNPTADTTTVAGITFTKNDDGTYTANGTATDFVGLSIGEIKLERDATVTYSGSPANGTMNTYSVNLRKVNGSWVKDEMGEGQTATLQADTAYAFYLVVRNGVTVNNLVFRPMVELGTTKTSYEPYVGGTASPNPDYPQAVQTTTGRQVVKIGGKNIFDKATMGLDGLYINLSNWTMGTGSNFGSAYAPCEPNTTYTISKTLTSRFAVGTSSVVPASGVSITEGLTNPSKADLTITTPADAKYIVVFLRSSSDSLTLAKILDTLQIERGSEATAYEAYRGVEHEINLGKNLFDKDDIESGYINSSGTIVADTNLYHSDYIAVEPGQDYTYSGTTNSTGYGAKAAWYDKDKNWLSSISFGASGTITAPSDAYFFRTSVGFVTGDEKTYQFEKGSTATDYAPYFNPIVLCQIGDYQDKIYKDGGKWYLYKATNKVSLVNYKDTIVSNRTTTSDNYRFRLTIPGIMPAASISTTIPTYCSHLTAGTAGNTWDKKQCIAVDTGTGAYVWLYTDETKTYSAANFQAWLEEKNPTYYYPLATPTTTEITNSALVAQLEALLAARLAAGYNTIDAESVDLPAWLEVEYSVAGEGHTEGGETWVDGGGGVSDVQINSTSMIYPVWQVDGPSVNPTIRNDTTDTVATYNGTVASEQVLTVDFETGVAHLDNVLATRLISGFVKCQPGTNTMGFDSDGGETTKCKIEWNNAIG